MRIAEQAGRNVPTRPGGFTVLEVVVAAFLLTVGLLATAQLLVVATSQGRLGKQASDASTLAAQTIEKYRDVNFPTLAAGTYITNPVVGADRYTVQAVVTANDPQPNMDRVRVTVSWNAGGQSYVSETILGPLQ
jgi:Tfp pilus assembly protein PilV